MGVLVVAAAHHEVLDAWLPVPEDAEELELPDLSFQRELASDPDRTRRIAVRLRDELRDLDDRLDGIEHRIGSILDGIEPDLPEPLRDLSRAFRTVADDHVSQLRAALGLEAR